VEDAPPAAAIQDVLDAVDQRQAACRHAVFTASESFVRWLFDIASPAPRPIAT
jgi:hypothetical protein